MRVLNAYAGIGGNRHLWPANWRVTAVELEPKTAAEYARRYPLDEVVTGDAHAFVMDFAGEFDAVWSSPPCPTHSRLAKVNAARYGRALAPDSRLWDEIAHLRTLEVAHVVENVHTYYVPPVVPDLVTRRHYYWASAVPVMLTPSSSEYLTRGARGDMASAGELAALYGLPPLSWGAVPDARKAMRNAVVPLEGLEVAMAAFVDRNDAALAAVS